MSLEGRMRPPLPRCAHSRVAQGVVTASSTSSCLYLGMAVCSLVAAPSKTQNAHCYLLTCATCLLQVNNAGILVSKVWDQETFDRTLAVNTKGPIAISQALLPHLAPDALIVMVSSGEPQKTSQIKVGFTAQVY